MPEQDGQWGPEWKVFDRRVAEARRDAEAGRPREVCARCGHDHFGEPETECCHQSGLTDLCPCPRLIREVGPTCRCSPGDRHPLCPLHGDPADLFAERPDPWLTHYDPFVHGRL